MEYVRKLNKNLSMLHIGLWWTHIDLCVDDNLKCLDWDIRVCLYWALYYGRWSSLYCNIFLPLQSHWLIQSSADLVSLAIVITSGRTFKTWGLVVKKYHLFFSKKAGNLSLKADFVTIITTNDGSNNMPFGLDRYKPCYVWHW